MYKKYVNKETKRIILVKKEEIEKTIQVINMLKVPKDYKTILDKRIEFISDKIFNENDLINYVFILKENLTSDLKGLFEFYYGSLSLFIYDELLENRPDLIETPNNEYDSFKERLTKKLEEQLNCCLKEQIKTSQFLIKEEYKGIVLYDPLKPAYMDKWELKETIA